MSPQRTAPESTVAATLARRGLSRRGFLKLGAELVVAVGTCAAFGGLPAAAPNPTGALSVEAALPPDVSTSAASSTSPAARRCRR